MAPHEEPKPRNRVFSGLNPLETIVLAAIALVALAGLMLVGKGLVLQSRADVAKPAPSLYASTI